MFDMFTEIYKKNLWGGSESVSGPGSSMSQTATIRQQIPVLCNRYEVTRILDAACGDFNWFRQMDVALEQYIGCDIVSDLIEQNNLKYADAKTSFVRTDIRQDPLPKMDLILCRDCLVHFSTADIQMVLDNFQKSGSKFLLLTTFPDVQINVDIQTGNWRPINFELPPFNFPKPLEILNENCPVSGFTDKSLALWNASVLPV